MLVLNSPDLALALASRLLRALLWVAGMLWLAIGAFLVWRSFRDSCDKWS